MFCDIVKGDAPAEILYRFKRPSRGAGRPEEPICIAVTPLNPVVPGHVLIIPVEHVADFTESIRVTADAMVCAAKYARHHRIENCNLITSRGAAATQTVFHLHVHLVPRTYGDNLHLPWTVLRESVTIE